MSDVISRQAAINTVHDMRKKCDTDNIDDYEEMLTVALQELCTAQRIGRWIPCTKNGLPLSEMAYRDGQKWYGYKCSNCNFIYKGNALTESPYCKKCGARMEGEA